MDNNNFELPLTNQALAELSATAAGLAAAFQAKKEQLQQRQAAGDKKLVEKESALSTLQSTSAGVLAGMENIISEIDRVLENNGTDNRNN